MKIQVAWDLVGEITFSQPIGYLDEGRDFDGTLANADQTMDYFALVSQIPFLDYVFDKNPVCKFFGPPGFATITQISLQHLLDRYAGKDGSYHDSSQPDYLDHFIEAKKLHPDIVDDGQIISCVLTWDLGHPHLTLPQVPSEFENLLWPF